MSKNIMEISKSNFKLFSNHLIIIIESCLFIYDFELPDNQFKKIKELIEQKEQNGTSLKDKLVE